MARSERYLMSIGQVAEAVGVATTALRYYERQGILSPTDRSQAGYRLYDETAVRRLRFVRSAQAVGFTLDDIRSLLQVDGESSCKDVQRLIERRLAEVNAKMADLKRLRAALTDAQARCRTSGKGCPVLVDLRSGRTRRKVR